MAGIVHPRVTSFNSGGVVVKEVVYPYPCIVHSIHVAHSTGAATFIQVFDASSAPIDTSVPQQVHSAASATDVHIEPGMPIYYENGVYVCESSTLVTKTLAAAAHLFVHLVVEVG